MTQLSYKQGYLFLMTSNAHSQLSYMHDEAGFNRPPINNLQTMRFLQLEQRKIITAGKLLIYKSKASCSTIYKCMGEYQGRFILDLSRNYNVIFIQRFLLLDIRLQRTTRNAQNIMKSLRPHSRVVLLQ